MNRILLLLLLTVAGTAAAQTSPTDEDVMKVVSTGKAYSMILFRKGPNRGKESPDQAKQTQMAHLRYLFSLKSQGILPLFGPFPDDGDIRGIGISTVTDTVKLRQLFSQDPHVKAGNLIVNFRPWFGIPGDGLPVK